MLTYRRMRPYLRFTPSSPRIIRETTTGRARRAGLSRVRKRRGPGAPAAVAQRDARPVHVGRGDERLEAHGGAVGGGGRARGRPGEGRRKEDTAPGRPEVTQPHRGARGGG